MGFINNGDIEHNTITLNQSTNPDIASNGGGIMVQGTPDTDPVCGTQIDTDCPPGLSDGTGHNLVINANWIQGNMAESGSGGDFHLYRRKQRPRKLRAGAGIVVRHRRDCYRFEPQSGDIGTLEQREHHEQRDH